jgi:large-conductance mechanosensitive channel
MGERKRISMLTNKMLDTKDIIILAAAFYLGNVVSRFFTALTEGIVAPLLAPLGGKGIAESVVVVGGVTLKTGELLAATIQLMISFAVVVYTIGVLRTYYLSKIGASRTA